MRWEEAWRVVGVLDREAVYGAHRGSDPTLDELKLLRLMRWSKTVSLLENLVAVLLVLLMICPPVLLASPVELGEAVRGATMLYNVLLFMLVFMVCSTSTLALQELGYLKVLLQLPLGPEDLKKVVMAYLIHEVAPILFIPPAYAVVVAERLASIPAFFLALAYGYASISLALVASISLSMVLWKKRGLVKGLRSKLMRAFWNSLYVLAMFSVGILYQAYAYASEMLSLLRKAHPGGLVAELVYPLSASEALLVEDVAELALSLPLALAYLSSFLLALDRALSAYTMRVAYVLHETVPGGGMGRPRPWLAWPPLAIALKDLKIALREPRTSYMMVLPLFSLLGFLPIVLAPATPSELETSLCLMFMTLFITGCLTSSLVPYQLMEHEGGRLWIPFSAISKRDMALGKSISSTLAYASYSLPMGLLASVLLGETFPFSYALSGIMVASSASLLSSMLIMAETSVDTRMIHVSLLKSLALMALSAALALPLIAPLLFVDVSSLYPALAGECRMALLVSGLELIVVLAANEVLMGLA